MLRPARAGRSTRSVVLHYTWEDWSVVFQSWRERNFQRQKFSHLFLLSLLRKLMILAGCHWNIQLFRQTQNLTSFIIGPTKLWNMAKPHVYQYRLGTVSSTLVQLYHCITISRIRLHRNFPRCFLKLFGLAVIRYVSCSLATSSHWQFPQEHSQELRPNSPSPHPCQ